MTQPIGKSEDLLIVSFSYYPMLNPRAFRWAALAEEFARRGVRVHVVCSWQPGLALNETVNGVEIHRVGNGLIERCRAVLAHFRGHRLQETGASLQSRPGSPFSKLIGWALRQIAWPDTTCVWYPAAVRTVNSLLSTLSQATLVTVTPSFSAALIGGAVARNKEGMRWVLDMGDPFTLATESPANNFLLYGALNRRVERAMFQRASAVSLTNSSIQREYAELYPESAKKLFVIPPLLSLDAMNSVKWEAAVSPYDDVIRVVYVGSLYKSLRRPDFLLALFMALTKEMGPKHLELHCLGRTDECRDAFVPYALQIGQTIILHGLVARESAFMAIREASIVVNLGNTNHCQLPSKLVEYMALGKPILNIIQTEADPSLALLQGYHSALTLLAAGTLPTIEQVHKVGQFIDQSVRVEGCVADSVRLDQFKLTAIADQYSMLFFSK
jgi:glycosyltransferase involved in cell wall biosynthesis